MMRRFSLLIGFMSGFVGASARAAGEEPRCLARKGSATVEATARAAGIGESEILARLVFAEGLSVNAGAEPRCAEQADAILEAIAWGVMSRVALGARNARLAGAYGKGVWGVVFKRGQFNPAVSPRSRFSKYFLCPAQAPAWRGHWRAARTAADRALAPGASNPFVQTEWEKKNGVSLVSHFYYPKSEQATKAPPSWADASAGSKTLVRDVEVGGRRLGNDCIWFFRNEKPF